MCAVKINARTNWSTHPAVTASKEMNSKAARVAEQKFACALCSQAVRVVYNITQHSISSYQVTQVANLEHFSVERRNSALVMIKLMINQC